MHFRLSAFSCLAVLGLAGITFAQNLTIASPPDRVQQFSAAAIAQMPHTLITANEHGKPVQFEGVLLRDLLKQSGAPVGDRLKGPNMAAYLYFSAKDGYHVSMALAEVDTAFQDNQILVADSSNGKPLTAEQGPFRLIVPEDKKPARWIRMLDRIEVKMPEDSHP